MSKKKKLSKQKRNSNFTKAKSGKLAVGPTKYNYALYKTHDTIQLNEQFGGGVIPKGETVVMPTSFPFDDKVEVIGIFEQLFSPIPTNKDLNNENILVIRYGGIGDIIASLYSIAELKIKFPKIRVAYMCSPSYIPILKCFPKLVDSVATPITRYSSFKHYNYIAYLDDVIENPDNNGRMMHEAYADVFGIKVDAITTDLVISCNMAIGHNERKGVGVQYKSSSAIRDYDIDKLCDLINRLNDDLGEPVYLLGQPNDYLTVNYIQSKTQGRVITNGCGQQELSLIQSMNLISQLKLVIAPDSAMIHMAGICETPSIGLYGAFHSDTRMAFYKNAIGINGNAICSPCNRHFPVEFCKHNMAECLGLNNISVDLIMDQVYKTITKVQPIALNSTEQEITEQVETVLSE